MEKKNDKRLKKRERNNTRREGEEVKTKEIEKKNA